MSSASSTPCWRTGTRRTRPARGRKPRRRAQNALPDPADPTDKKGAGGFDFPDPPETIPDWARRDAEAWRRLSLFDLEVKAEASSGLEVEIRNVDLPEGVWGLHVARGDRARLCVNSRLPRIWQRFALFHELYHLVYHTEGERFWQQTFQPMSRFESEADLFAWAAVWPEWGEGGDF